MLSTSSLILKTRLVGLSPSWTRLARLLYTRMASAIAINRAMLPKTDPRMMANLLLLPPADSLVVGKCPQDAEPTSTPSSLSRLTKYLNRAPVKLSSTRAFSSSLVGISVVVLKYKTPPNTSSYTGKLSNCRRPRRRSSSSNNISFKRSASQPLVRKECNKCSVVTVVTVSRLNFGCCLLDKNRSPNGSIAVNVSSTDAVCSTARDSVGLYVGLSDSSGSSGEVSILGFGTLGAL
mmetsp:Transcript_24140/g.37850  ORF Transcript_24140/g.37850 Transcript_24140/m.37850 type:complete len:235 (-) Transcript_24140:906-1610(-)